MLLQKRITYKVYLVLGFVLVHLLLINVNAAEWGDSYRILRAAEFIKKGQYPADEKRPPLLATVLASRPTFVDPVFYGRAVVLVFATFSFIIFLDLLSRLVKEQKYVVLGALLYALNPINLYWSLRVMSDVPFSFFALVCLYLLYIWKNNLSIKKLMVLGLLAGMSILTRFEGYLLAAAMCVWVVFPDGISLKGLLARGFRALLFVVAVSAVAVPYIVYSNPLGSSYLDEPAGRAYDLRMVEIYLASVLAVFGFIGAFFVIVSQARTGSAFLLKNVGIATFTLFILVLVLLWPAALPRLFMPILPFLVVVLTLAFMSFFRSSGSKVIEILSLVGLTLAYLVSQYFFKLQFLGLPKAVFIVLCVFQLLLIPLLIKRRFVPFVCLLILSLSVWSGSVVWLHKDIFKAIKNASEYTAQNIVGRVAYNDISSVSNWYLNVRNNNPYLSAFYYDFEKDALLEYTSLVEHQIDYLLITNEHNTTLDIDLSKRPYLELMREFSYNINDKQFESRVVKVRKFTK